MFVLHFLMSMLRADLPLTMVGMQVAATPTTAADLFTNPLGVKLLAVGVLLLTAVVVALVVGCLLKLGFKSSWKTTLITTGCTFVGTFGISYKIMIYLMP